MISHSRTYTSGGTSQKTLLALQVCERRPHKLRISSLLCRAQKLVHFAARPLKFKANALNLKRRTEGAEMQLSRLLATAEAEWSEFRLTQCAQQGANLLNAKPSEAGLR